MFQKSFLRVIITTVLVRTGTRCRNVETSIEIADLLASQCTGHFFASIVANRRYRAKLTRSLSSSCIVHSQSISTDGNMNGSSNGYHSNGHSNGQNHGNNGNHAAAPLGAVPRDHPIAVIGAGVAGVATAVALAAAGYTQFVVYDKNAGLGGLWHQNYPGASGTFLAMHRLTHAPVASTLTCLSPFSSWGSPFLHSPNNSASI
jgi:NAD(P)-binding Rossmann-like domain